MASKQFVNGKRRFEWARRHMPVMDMVNGMLSKSRPFENVKISACLHVTAETAVLVDALRAGGARVFLTASNPLSTQDDIAEFLSSTRTARIHSAHGESKADYTQNILRAIAFSPDLIVDDGADLITAFHNVNPLGQVVIGATEETSTGVLRLRNLETKSGLQFPVVAVNDSDTKRMFDNRYGTGQSVVDGVMRATNMLLAGRNVVVCGYGWCGRGIASRMRGMGALVCVTEISPIKALEAAMDGFEVMTMDEAAGWGDLFVTATGNAGVIRASHMRRMSDGAVLCNAGHFDVEVQMGELRKISKGCSEVRPGVKEYRISEKKNVCVISDGRLVNLGAAEGHPPGVMDMSFANQALSLEWLAENRDRLGSKVIDVPRHIQDSVAKFKLASMGIEIDSLTRTQEEYLSAWSEGT